MRRSKVTRLGDGVDAERHALRGGQRAGVRARSPSTARTIDEPRLRGATSRCSPRPSATPPTAPSSPRACASDYGLDARVLSGEEEAQLTFLGAMSRRASAADEPTVVIDIGGGSTEFVVGVERTAGFHVSLPAGVVRMSERHIHSDPPGPAELAGARGATSASVLARGSARATSAQRSARGIAVAGTATSAASIDQELDPYDPERVHGYELALATVEVLLARLADMNEAAAPRGRRAATPTARRRSSPGMILLGEAMRAFGARARRGLRARHPLRRRAAPRRRGWRRLLRPGSTRAGRRPRGPSAR